MWGEARGEDDFEFMVSCTCRACRLLLDSCDVKVTVLHSVIIVSVPGTKRCDPATSFGFDFLDDSSRIPRLRFLDVSRPGRRVSVGDTSRYATVSPMVDDSPGASNPEYFVDDPPCVDSSHSSLFTLQADIQEHPHASQAARSTPSSNFYGA